MKLLIGIVYIMALIMECFAIYFLVKHDLILFVITHSIASLTLAMAFDFFAQHTFADVKPQFKWFTLLLCFFIPLFGWLISSYILFVLYITRKGFHEHSEIFDASINLTTIKPVQASYGAGGAFNQLMEQKQTTNKRTKALLSIAKGSMAQLNKLMFNLLPDSSDEIRLLAYSILDQQEVVIEKDIRKLKDLLASSSVTGDRHAKFEKNLAILHWELIYRGLVLRELQEVTLKKAQEYALSALKELKDDPLLWSLLGRIYLRSKQLDLAEEAFKKTLQLNISPSQVLPYIAEIEYKKHHYVEVQKYLNQSDTLLDIPVFAPVKRFWGNV